jgi:hypothetical protein
MTQSRNQGFYTQGGGATSSGNQLLATVPALACITRIGFTGYWGLEAGAYEEIAADTQFNFNCMAGLQWVPEGGTPVDLDTTSPGGAQWIQRAEGIAGDQVYVLPASGVSYIGLVAVPVNMQWRGQFYAGEDIDVYASAGYDATRADVSAGKLFGDFSILWATYP